ncbi:MAG: hypothetical protein GOV15_04365 [Candidatus Diapherotrites archaeon]|nr:hypothetical protein [Candidatus Diapherotrites archaeon]
MALKLKAKGMKQKTIAELLRIENAAVSQYLSGKRGNKIQLADKILAEVGVAAEAIGDDKSLIRETQRLLRLVRESGELCRIHRQLYGVPTECTPEFVDCFAVGGHNCT